MSLSLLRSSSIHSVLPTPVSYAELWSHQEPVTEHCFTYNRLGPGTGQVSRTDQQTSRSSLSVQAAVYAKQWLPKETGYRGILGPVTGPGEMTQSTGPVSQPTLSGPSWSDSGFR